MLKFIGIGSAFNTEMGNTSAYIKDGETLLLLDCGEMTFARMRQLKLLDDVKNVYVAITHMHADHVGSLAGLIDYLYIYKNIVTNLILTNGETHEEQERVLKTYLNICGVDEEKFEFTFGDMMEDVLPGLEKIELEEIKHSKNLISYAVELYFKDSTIYYTGDNNDKAYLKKIAKKLKPNDIVYTDCTNIDYKNRPHVTIEELCEVFSDELKKQVYTMHFDSYAVINDAKKAGFKTVSAELSLEELLKQIVNKQ